MHTLTTTDDSKMPKWKRLFTPRKFTRRAAANGGASRSSGGHLEIKLSIPGTHGTGTNPEQLLAPGWSACFTSAILIAAKKQKITLPPDTAVDAEVDLCNVDGAYFVQARLNVNLPGIEQAISEEIVQTAHQICPYSKVTRGNINLVIDLL
jgi:lipoyl-dependent peroxiredoxin